MKVLRFRPSISQYTNVPIQRLNGLYTTNNTSLNINNRINIKNEVTKLLENPQLTDNLYRFCITANACSISPKLRIYLSDLVPKTLNLKFTNSKSILQHQKFTVIFVLKSLSRLPSLVYTNNRHEENSSNLDLSASDYLSLNDIFHLSIESLGSRYKGRIEEHSREVLEIFDSLLDTCKFVSRYNLTHIYSYLSNAILSFAINISTDLVNEFNQKKQNLYPLIFKIGKFLEIHGIKNKELYDIIYHSICNPEKWIQMNYSKLNYQKFILDSITNLLQFKLPQDKIDKLTQYLLVSDILSIENWSTLFLYITRFSFNKTTLDLALMTFIRKYKYCKFPTNNNPDETNSNIDQVPSITNLVKTIDVTTGNVYFNVKATRTCHDRTFTSLTDLDSDYTYKIISGLINIIKRIKLDQVTGSHIDEVLELLFPKVIQLLPTYSLTCLKPIASIYIDYISKDLISLSDMGYSNKHRNVVRSIATELIKYIPIFTLQDYIQSSDLISKIHCNIEYNGNLYSPTQLSNQLIIDCISGLFNEDFDEKPATNEKEKATDEDPMSVQQQVLMLDFPNAVKFSQQIFKLKETIGIPNIEMDRVETLVMLLKERIINSLGSMNQDHLNANSYSIVLLNMISLNFKGITQFMETFENLNKCLKILPIDDKIDILRITTGQPVNEDFNATLVEELRENIAISNIQLKLFKYIIILKKLVESIDHLNIVSFLLYTIPNISRGEFLAELLEISASLDHGNCTSRQFTLETLITASTKQLNITQLKDYLKCCRLIGHSIDMNKCLEVPLHTASIQQIEGILSEVTQSRACDHKVIKRLVDWSIHLYSENDGDLPVPMAIDCFSKILSHLSFFNTANSKLFSLSSELLIKYYKDYQAHVVPMLNFLVKFDQYPNKFDEIFVDLLTFSGKSDDLQPLIHKQLYEIYLQSLISDHSLHKVLESNNLMDILNGLPSYHWYKDQEKLANEFKNTEIYPILFDAITEITGVRPGSCTANPYFVHFIFENNKDSLYNNMVILLVNPLDKTLSNDFCGETLLKLNYLNKLGYKVITLDSTGEDLREKLKKLL